MAREIAVRARRSRAPALAAGARRRAARRRRARRDGHRQHDRGSGARRCAPLGADRRPSAAAARASTTQGVARKVDGRRRARSTANRDGRDDPLRSLAAFGGFEIAFLAGVALGARARRVPSCSSTASSRPPPRSSRRASRPRAAPRTWSRRTARRSRATRSCSTALGLEPLLDLELRLGEGTRRRARAAAPRRGARDPARDGDLRRRPASPMPVAERAAALAAVAFLTRVPVGRLVALDGRDVARGARALPARRRRASAPSSGGVADGLAADAAGRSPRRRSRSSSPRSLTGALHLDALADTADALGGSTRERALEIMRDHAIGAYGAVALVLVLPRRGVGARRARGDGRRRRFAGCRGAQAAAASLPLARAACAPARRDGRGVAASPAAGALGRSRARRRGRGRRRSSRASTASPSSPPRRRDGARRRPRSRGAGSAASPATSSVRRPSWRGRGLVASWRVVTRLILVRHAEAGRDGARAVLRAPRRRPLPRGREQAAGSRPRPMTVAPSSRARAARARDGRAARRRRPRRSTIRDLRELDFGELEGRTYEEIERERPELFAAG